MMRRLAQGPQGSRLSCPLASRAAIVIPPGTPHRCGLDPRLRRRLHASPVKIRSYLFVLTAAALLPLVVFSALITGVLWKTQQSAQDLRFSERVKGMSIALDRELLGSMRVLEILARSASLDTEDLAIV